MRPHSSLLVQAALFVLAFALWPVLSAGQEVSYDLKPEQIERLKKFIPKTYAKLVKREPVNVIAVGDSIMEFYVVRSDDTGNVLKSYEGLFLQTVADQFYYTGGVRLYHPAKNMPAKTYGLSGPEIVMHSLARGGKLIIHAMQTVGTTGMETKPDLAMVSFGINDGNFDLDLGTYRRSLQEVIDYLKQRNVELMLFGSTLIAPDPPESGLALTRPFADAMREVAEANSIFFADLGDLAWFVRLDDRSTAPSSQKNKKKDANPQGKALPERKPSPVQIPVSDDDDPDPEKKAAKFFNQVVEGYRHSLSQGTYNDLVHPNPGMHRTLARRLFDELLDGPKDVPWTVGDATVELPETDKCVLSYTVKNATDAPLRVYLLPLISRGWMPKEAKSYIDLKAGKQAPISVTYARSQPMMIKGAPATPLPPSEALFRLPILLMGDGMARIETLRADITPMTMLWKTGTQYNQDKSFTISGSLKSNSKETIEVKWDAEWMGQKHQGTTRVAGGGESPVELSFKLPEESPGTPNNEAMVFNVAFGGQTLRLYKTISIAQNFGLRQTMSLYSRNALEVGQTPLKPSKEVSFRTDADAGALYLMWDITGINLEDNPKNGAAITVELNMDARSYGKRLTPGSTDSVRASCGAADGDATIGPLQPWMFGPGYSRDYLPGVVKGRLSSRADGSRRFTLMLPRSLFTLHEWALGNGNSQLGFNASLAIWQRPVAGGVEGGERDLLTTHFAGLHRDDAQSLAVLELTDKPTRRWSVRFY